MMFIFLLQKFIIYDVTEKGCILLNTLSFLVFVKPVHSLNLGTQNAPDCISEYLNFQNFPGGMPLTPLAVFTFGTQIGPYAPKLSPPASLLSTSTLFEKENPAFKHFLQTSKIVFDIWCCKKFAVYSACNL